MARLRLFMSNTFFDLLDSLLLPSFYKTSLKKIYCCWSWGQQFSPLLLLIAFSALPSIPPKVSSPKPGRGGQYWTFLSLPCCLYINSRGFCHIDFSQEKEPFLTPPRLQLSPLCLVSSSWLNVMLAVPSSEVTVPFSGIPPSWYSMFEVLWQYVSLSCRITSKLFGCFGGANGL